MKNTSSNDGTETKNPSGNDGSQTKNTGSDDRTKTKNTDGDDRTKTKNMGGDDRTKTKNTGGEDRTKTKNMGGDDRTKTKSTGGDNRTKTTSKQDNNQYGQGTLDARELVARIPNNAQGTRDAHEPIAHISDMRGTHDAHKPAAPISNMRGTHDAQIPVQQGIHDAHELVAQVSNIVYRQEPVYYGTADFDGDEDEYWADDAAGDETIIAGKGKAREADSDMGPMMQSVLSGMDLLPSYPHVSDYNPTLDYQLNRLPEHQNDAMGRGRTSVVTQDQNIPSDPNSFMTYYHSSCNAKRDHDSESVESRQSKIH